MQVKFRISDEAWEQFLAHTDSPGATIRELVTNYPTEPLESVIGVHEAAELWGYTPGTIKNMCRMGKIKAKNIGKTWIIDKNQSPRP